MCLHFPPLLDSYLKREKNCFSLKVPSDIQRAFSFTRLLNTIWQRKRGISITFLKGHFKILNHFVRVSNLKIMLKCFCPVIFRLEWLSAFCEIFKRCFLSFPAEVFKVFPSKLFRYLQLKYSKYFPPSYSGICRCFATICWARTSAWASQSSGSHIRWWFISQTSPFSSTFYINQLFRFILH